MEADDDDTLHSSHALANPRSICMELITEPERVYLLELVQKRMDFMYGDAHGIAYLLDPQYLGAGMSVETRLQIEDLIVAHPSTDSFNTPPTQEEQQSVYKDYTNSDFSYTNETFCINFRDNAAINWSTQVLAVSR